MQDAARAAMRRAGIPSARLLLTTSGSLTGAMVVSSALGAAFWWLAARLFDPYAVGIAAASISAMTLLGAVSVLGTGSLLLRELPRRVGEERQLISTALTAVVALSTVAGVAFALVAPSVNPDLASLAANVGIVALFAFGVALTAAGTVVDHALLGMLRAPVQFMRNCVFAGAKLVALPAAMLIASVHAATAIYAVWVFGAVLSLGLVAALHRGRLRPVPSARLVRELGPSTLTHFALNTALVLPTLLMPVMVALLAPPIVAGQFYVAWMLASVSFFVPVALAQSLYAVGGRRIHELWAHARSTATISIGAGLAAVIGAYLLAEPVLSLFGPTYREAAGAAVLMTAISIPLSIKDHFQVLSRIRGRAGFAAAVCTVGGVVEVAGGLAGMVTGGIDGLAAGWLFAVAIEAALFAPLAYRAARAVDHGG